MYLLNSHAMFHNMDVLQSIPHIPTDNIQEVFICPATTINTAINNPIHTALCSGALFTEVCVTYLDACLLYIVK